MTHVCIFLQSNLLTLCACSLTAGNFLPESEGLVGKGGEPYYIHGGLCLETQNFPDFVHHSNFPAGILHPGHTYQHVLELRLFTHPRA